MNPDESQTITQAITLLRDPIYWASVDGTTIGPVNSYLLLIPSIFGFPLDYIGARVVGLGLILLSLYFFSKGLRLFMPEKTYRLVLLGLSIFFGWTVWYDFLHYTSELSSLPILTGCFYMVSAILTGRKHSVSWYFVLGIVAGIIPYCKLQSVPILAGPIIITYTYIFAQRRNLFKLTSALSLGLVVPSILVLGFCLAYHVLPDFYLFYIESNLLGYKELYSQDVAQKTIWAKLMVLPYVIAHYLDLLPLIGICWFLGFLCLQVYYEDAKQISRGNRWQLGLGFITGLLAIYCVASPGTRFGHHLLLLVFPIAWLIGCCLAIVKDRFSVGFVQKLTIGLPSTFLFFILLRFTLYGFFSESSSTFNPHPSSLKFPERAEIEQDRAFHINPFLYCFTQKMTMSESAVSREIKKLTEPEEQIAVWGWNCTYYVESQRSQGVRENQTQRCAVKNSYQAIYLSRYVADLAKNKPALFLDAVGPASLHLNEAHYEHQNFRLLASYIAKHYKFLKVVSGVRIFKRIPANEG
ncbi:hypothetical protein EHT25_19170 [Larkinella rosea]|uniref:Glycosyltransferase RgtA/B/C/D-like domain-containing protein n=1 Tax=Larkinella rosea TaxID=2025312 RepID=A0A3P1BNT4_9BACT|nr:hypothetical protein EHT25_19170 [Larkinella rosea]